MFIYWKGFGEASLSFTEPSQESDNQNKNYQGEQTHSWMDLLTIVELHCWGFPGVTKKFHVACHFIIVELHLHSFSQKTLAELKSPQYEKADPNLGHGWLKSSNLIG